MGLLKGEAAAAAAKLLSQLQSCPTLCDPIDGSPLLNLCLLDARDNGASTFIDGMDTD